MGGLEAEIAVLGDPAHHESGFVQGRCEDSGRRSRSGPETDPQIAESIDLGIHILGKPGPQGIMGGPFKASHSGPFRHVLETVSHGFTSDRSGRPNQQ